MQEDAPRPWRDTGDLPDPPWRAERRPSSRVPLTRQAIVDAALRVMDSEGVDRLSMRRLGEELGVGAASIYWHVRNKDELLQLVFERIMEEAELPPPDPSRWQEQLGEFAGQMRAIFSRHRDAARISLGRAPTGPVIAVFTEWLFSLLRPAGIPDQVIAYLGDLIGLYVGAFAFEESLRAGSPGLQDPPPGEFLDMVKDYLRSLPEDRFPHTRQAADFLFAGGRDDRYAFGIDLMIRGLKTFADQPPR
ncbi:MAG: TetR/AcrR family transcriptional regulator [Streptosporangiales bacterium]|nr:TetR/AcrR family transcriptional regulator [Streptosporangiales bacterium]